MKMPKLIKNPPPRRGTPFAKGGIKNAPKEQVQYKMLFALCFPEKREWMQKTLEHAKAYNITLHLVGGIQRTNIVNLLGLNDSNRIMMTAFIEEKEVAPLFKILQDELYGDSHSGIAFTVNIDGYAGAKSMILIDEFLRRFEEGAKNGKNA